MNKIFLSLGLIVIILTGCSTENDIIEAEIESINILTKKERSSPDRSSHIIPGTITLKYANGVTERDKKEVREKTYKSFTLKRVELAKCNNVEKWYILYDPFGQPGPAGEVKKENNDDLRNRRMIIEEVIPGNVLSCEKI